MATDRVYGRDLRALTIQCIGARLDLLSVSIHATAAELARNIADQVASSLLAAAKSQGEQPLGRAVRHAGAHPPQLLQVSARMCCRVPRG